MRLMIDVVINHTSDQNEWFVKSKSSKDNPYRGYYFWKDAKEGLAPNNYPSFFGGSAWQKDEKANQYYLQIFGVPLDHEDRDLREDGQCRRASQPLVGASALLMNNPGSNVIVRIECCSGTAGVYP